MKLFAKQVYTYRLGEWLVNTGRVKQKAMDAALVEQHVNSLEDFLIYYKITDSESLEKIKDKLGLR